MTISEDNDQRDSQLPASAHGAESWCLLEAGAG